MIPALDTTYRRAGWFTLLLLLVNVVLDGYSGRPSEFTHQFLLLPLTFLFLFGMGKFLFAAGGSALLNLWSPSAAMRLALFFEGVAMATILFEARHFAFLGYHFYPILIATVFAVLLIPFAFLAFKGSASGLQILTLTLACYIGGLTLAIVSFPLNYLRSDMLPVILWADTNLVHHISPYATMFIGGRVYDFPYLPGMLVAFLPFIAAHIDIRFGSMFYVVACATLIFWAARRDRRREVAALLALFILCPFLQYRHDLYLQPHWFALVLSFVLMQRRHFAWAAVAFGAGMAIYQFSWILFPFFLLNAFRRRGWTEALKLAALAALGALVIVGPFLSSALHRISSNTVGQWGRLPHALAEPINLSYWATFLIRPDQLLRLQAAVMIAIFLFCVLRNRCATLADTLRWMIVALTLFILLNVIVDGYFYLMLLVPMLVFTCVSNNWWRGPEPDTLAPDTPAA